MKYDHSFSDLKYLALDLPEIVKIFHYSGDFTGEMKCIDGLLSRPQPEPMKKRLMLAYSIAEYMEQNYKTDDEALLARLRTHHPLLEPEDVDKIVATGHADYILRGGKRYFEDDAASNIRNECGDFMTSLHDPTHVRQPYLNEFYHRNMKELKENGTAARYFRVRMAVRPTDEIAEAYEGKPITVHLPVPAQAETQSEIRILGSSDPCVVSNAAQRTACIRTLGRRPGEFYWVEFSYVNRAVYHDVKPELVSEEQPDFCTGEEYPHIRFTPYLRALAKEIAGEETNRLLLARRVYDYVTTQIRYSYMRPYFAIENLPEFAALNGRGDCGIQALLFITLCRILGIPAKWESGHGMYDASLGSHDWATYYVAPWGWLRADLSRGGSAYRNLDEELHDFWFANMDPYRDVTCTEFQTDFLPEKKFPRIDPYDNQNGEIEFEDRGLKDWEILTERTVLECRKVD